MLERLWTSILELMAQVVTPDWGVLVSLIPVGILILVVVVLIRLFRMLATRAAGASRQGASRPRKTPAGIHMPGPSFAPVFAGVGLFLVMLGLVFGGVILVLGVDRAGPDAALLARRGRCASTTATSVRRRTTLPADIHDGPPPGVHMPGPVVPAVLRRVRVFALLFLGLVFGGWLLAVGVIALITTLVGWLTDAVKEYVETVEADRTGHLDNGPAPATPRRLFTVLAVLFVGAAVLQSGVFASRRGQRRYRRAGGSGVAARRPGPPGARSAHPGCRRAAASRRRRPT